MNPNDELTADEKEKAHAYFDAYRIGRAEERKRIVAWLRGRAEGLRAQAQAHPRAAADAVALDVAAVLIEDRQEPTP